MLLTIFFFALHFNIILPQRKSKKILQLNKQIEFSSSSNSLLTSTYFKKNTPSTLTLLGFSPLVIDKRHSDVTKIN